ncbi:MAG: hypothetical protein QM727_04390 [Niabella sp.]
MRKPIALIFSYLLLVGGLSAQEPILKNGRSYNNPYTIYSCKDYRLFFANHPDIQKVVVHYEQDVPLSVYIWFEKDSIILIRETYDLGFIGDEYLFKQLYGPFVIPLFPNSKVENLPLLPGPHCKAALLDKLVTISEDEVKYEFRINCSSGEEKVTYNKRYIGAPAKYSGDISTLSRSAESLYIPDKDSSEIDSVLIFRGIVNQEGVLNNIEMVSGRGSKFSEAVLYALERSKYKWTAADIGVGSIKTYIRVYAHLNKEGTITILTPHRLLNASGI